MNIFIAIYCKWCNARKIRFIGSLQSLLRLGLTRTTEQINLRVVLNGFNCLKTMKTNNKHEFGCCGKIVRPTVPPNNNTFAKTLNSAAECVYDAPLNDEHYRLMKEIWNPSIKRSYRMMSCLTIDFSKLQERLMSSRLSYLTETRHPLITLKSEMIKI